MFTTRPELRGTFGMVASTHWLASQTGMAVLERGGNAFDAAVATGFVLQVVEPHLNGPGGEVPAVFWSADRGEPLALCGQGVLRPRPRSSGSTSSATSSFPAPVCSRPACQAPSAAGSSSCATSGPGGSRTCSSSRSATRSSGYPLHERIRATIELNEELIASWPGSRDLYLPAPEAGALFRNPALARDVSPHRRREPRRIARGRDREGAARVVRGLRRRGDRPLLRGRGRASHRRRHGRVAGDARAGRHARLSRADRVQDAALGAGPGRPPAARAPRGLRPRGACRRPSSST